MEPKDLTYKILRNKETGEEQYFLDDRPWTFVDPKLVKVGSIIYFDPNGLNRWGIVTNIRKDDFLFYDVGFPGSLNIEEVACFQVYKIDSQEEVKSND